MARSDDRLPPVEIIGSEPELGSVQRVSAGGRGGTPRRRVVAGVAVVGLLAAGLLLGQGDESEPQARAPRPDTTTTERTTTSRRSTTTTRPTTTTTVPTGPVLAGQGLTGWLLSGNVDGWTLIDIGSGAISTPDLPFDDPYSTRAVTGGVITVSGGAVAYHDLRVPEEAREPIPLGQARQVFAAADRDHVWLLVGPEDGTEADRYRARLVDLRGREVRAFSVPATGYVAAIEGGMLFQRGGRVFLASESGVRAIAVGSVLGAVGSAFVTLTCDKDASCGIDLRGPTGTRIRRLPLDASAVEQLGVDISSDPSGRFTVVTYGTESRPDDPHLWVFEADGSLAGTFDPDGFLTGPVSRLPGRAGFIVVHSSRIAWLRPTGDGWTLEELPGLARVSSEGVLAIVVGAG